MATHIVRLVKDFPDLLAEGVHLSDSTRDFESVPGPGGPQIVATNDYRVVGLFDRGGERWCRLRNIETTMEADFRVADIGELSYRVVRRRRGEERIAAADARDRARLARRRRARSRRK